MKQVVLTYIIGMLLLVGNAYAFEKGVTNTVNQTSCGDSVYTYMGKPTTTPRIWDSPIEPLPKENMRTSTRSTNNSVMNYAKPFKSNRITRSDGTPPHGVSADLLPELFVGEFMDLHPNGQMDECRTTVEPGRGLVFKRVIPLATGGAKVILGGLVPRGADVVTACHVVNGVRQTTPVTMTYRAVSIFGAEVVNPSVNALRLRLLAQPLRCHFGAPGKYYLAAAFQGQFFFYSNSTRSWAPFQGGAPLPTWFEAPIQEFETQTAIANLDISGLPGLQLWMGYGRNESEMIDYAQLKMVYSAPSGN